MATCRRRTARVRGTSMGTSQAGRYRAPAVASKASGSKGRWASDDRLRADLPGGARRLASCPSGPRPGAPGRRVQRPDRQPRRCGDATRRGVRGRVCGRFRVAAGKGRSKAAVRASARLGSTWARRALGALDEAVVELDRVSEGRSIEPWDAPMRSSARSHRSSPRSLSGRIGRAGCYRRPRGPDAGRRETRCRLWPRLAGNAGSWRLPRIWRRLSGKGVLSGRFNLRESGDASELHCV